VRDVKLTHEICILAVKSSGARLVIKYKWVAPSTAALFLFFFITESGGYATE
jgi:hypothetical protein